MNTLINGKDGLIYDSNMVENLLKQGKKVYLGFPYKTTSQGVTNVSDFLRGSDSRFRNREIFTKEELFDPDNNFYTEFGNEFEVYLIGFSSKNSGGSHVKVLITDNHNDFYLIDMFEYDLYEFLLENPQPNKITNGQLSGLFKMYQHASGLKPISESDRRLL